MVSPFAVGEEEAADVVKRRGQHVIESGFMVLILGVVQVRMQQYAAVQCLGHGRC